MAQSGGFSEIVVARTGGIEETGEFELLFAHKIRPFRSSVLSIPSVYRLVRDMKSSNITLSH